MTVDKRFALIDQDGATRFPYRKREHGTGREGFASGRDRHGEGVYLDTINQVIRAVVWDGAAIRVRAVPTTKGKHGNSLKLHAGREVVGYRIAPELRYLVLGAKVQPLDDSDPSMGDFRVRGGLSLGAAEEEIAVDSKCRDLDRTQRQVLAQARIGQGKFRCDVAALWDTVCSVTGCGLAAALIASHIKPWASSTNAERLDKFNGLYLSASIDALFDSGLVSFGDDGEMIRAAHVSIEDLSKLGIHEGARLRTVPAQTRRYLAEHRRTFGFE